MKAKLLRPLPRVLDEKEAQQQLEHLDVETCAMKEGGDRERSRKKVSKMRGGGIIILPFLSFFKESTDVASCSGYCTMDIFTIYKPVARNPISSRKSWLNLVWVSR